MHFGGPKWSVGTTAACCAAALVAIAARTIQTDSFALVAVPVPSIQRIDSVLVLLIDDAQLQLQAGRQLAGLRRPLIRHNGDFFYRLMMSQALVSLADDGLVDLPNLRAPDELGARAC